MRRMLKQRVLAVETSIGLHDQRALVLREGDPFPLDAEKYFVIELRRLLAGDKPTSQRPLLVDVRGDPHRRICTDESTFAELSDEELTILSEELEKWSW